MSKINFAGSTNLVGSASQEREQRKKAVDFVFNNSRLEGLVYKDAEVEQLYQDYIDGYINSKALGDKVRAIITERLAEAVVA